MWSCYGPGTLGYRAHSSNSKTWVLGPGCGLPQSLPPALRAPTGPRSLQTGHRRSHWHHKAPHGQLCRMGRDQAGSLLGLTSLGMAVTLRTAPSLFEL